MMNISDNEIENLLENYERDENWSDIKGKLTEYNKELDSLDLLDPSITMEINTIDDNLLAKRKIEIMIKSNETNMKGQCQNLIDVKYLLNLMQEFIIDKKMNVIEE